MGFFTRFILKNGPGSPGQTARAICKHLKKYKPVDYNNEWKYYLHQIVWDRKTACLSNPLGFNDERNYHRAINDTRWQELVDKTQGSLSALIFILMYFEAHSFRNAVAESYHLSDDQKRENRNLILGVIYEVVSKTPYNRSFSLRDTVGIVDSIGGYYSFLISTNPSALS